MVSKSLKRLVLQTLLIGREADDLCAKCMFFQIFSLMLIQFTLLQLYSFIQENTNRVKKFGELAYVVDPAAVNHLKRNKSYFQVINGKK